METRRRIEIVTILFIVMMALALLLSLTPVEAASAPGQVKNLKAISNGYHSIKLTWNKTFGASAYRIYRATGKTSTYKIIKEVGKNSTAYTNLNLTSGKAKYYKVRAVKKSGSKVISFGKYSGVAASAPKGKIPVLTVTPSYYNVKLSWTKTPDATGYQVYRAATNNGAYAKVTATSNTNFKDTARYPNTEYYYKVRPYKKADGKIIYGSFSAIKSAKTKIPMETTEIDLKFVDRLIKNADVTGKNIDKSLSKNGMLTYCCYSSNQNNPSRLKHTEVGYVYRYFDSAAPINGYFQIKVKKDGVTAYYTTDGTVPGPVNGKKVIKADGMVKLAPKHTPGTEFHYPGDQMDLKVHAYKEGKLVCLYYWNSDTNLCVHS